MSNQFYQIKIKAYKYPRLTGEAFYYFGKLLDTLVSLKNSYTEFAEILTFLLYYIEYVVGGIEMDYTLVYSINNEKSPETVYVNLTNSCTNRCIFCLREQKNDVCGAEMWHDDNYKLEDVISQFEAYKPTPKEVVFCGYGEPFLRREMMKEVCKYLRANYPEVKIRVNTNGHANAIYKTNVAEEFKNLIDTVSVSLNAADTSMYDEICKPKISNAYEEVKKFIKACTDAGIKVSASIVTGFDKIHNIDTKKCEEIARSLGAEFRNREFITNGY